MTSFYAVSAPSIKCRVSHGSFNHFRKLYLFGSLDFLNSFYFFLRYGFKTGEQNGGKKRSFLLQDIMVAIHQLNLHLRMILTDFKVQIYLLKDHVHVAVPSFPPTSLVRSQTTIHRSYLIISLCLILELAATIHITKTDNYAIQMCSAVFIDRILNIISKATKN